MIAVSLIKMKPLVRKVEIKKIHLLLLLAADGISLASLGPIVEKCSLNISDRSVGLVIETPSTVSSFTEQVLLLREVSSFTVCQVRRESFLCLLNDFL